MKKKESRLKSRKPTADESAGIALMIEKAVEHYSRGGPRGVYRGEKLNTAVIIRIDAAKGPVIGNIRFVSLAASLLLDAGFSEHDVREFFGSQDSAPATQ